MMKYKILTGRHPSQKKGKQMQLLCLSDNTVLPNQIETAVFQSKNESWCQCKVFASVEGQIFNRYPMLAFSHGLLWIEYSAEHREFLPCTDIEIIDKGSMFDPATISFIVDVDTPPTISRPYFLKT